jgi:hypothetical protein
MVKMSPTESEVYADLVISVSSVQYERKKERYDSMKKGDEIEFSGYLVSMGNEFKMHHIHAKGDIAKTGKNMEIG